MSKEKTCYTLFGEVAKSRDLIPVRVSINSLPEDGIVLPLR
jgi:hypothetical protein